MKGEGAGIWPFIQVLIDATTHYLGTKNAKSMYMNLRYKPAPACLFELRKSSLVNRHGGAGIGVCMLLACVVRVKNTHVCSGIDMLCGSEVKSEAGLTLVS